MKKLLFVTLLILSNFTYALDLVLVDSPIKDFVQWTAKQSNRNIILSDSITGNVSVNARYLNQKDLLPFFIEVMSANGYQVVEADTSLIVTIDSNNDVKEQFFTFETHVYNFENMIANRALTALETMMFSKSRDSSGAGQLYKIAILENGNGVVITTTKELHSSIARFLPSIDVTRKLVMIEAIVVEKQINDNSELGFNYNILPNKTNGINAGFGDSTINQNAGFLSILNSGDIVAMVDALETNDNVDILSKPKLITLDRESASIVVGQNVPFVVGTTIDNNDATKQFQTIEREDVGLTLSFTPYIVGNKINIKVNQTISSVSTSTQASDIITNKRSISTFVSCKSGQLVTLGGLIETTKQQTESGVPVLKDIPFIGKAFTHTTEKVKKTELSLIIQARII